MSWAAALRAAVFLATCAMACVGGGSATASPPASAAPPAAVPLRVGAHDGFERVVLEPPAGVSAAVEQSADRVLVRLTPPLPIATATPPRNIRAITVGPGVAELSLMPGALARVTRLGARVVIDVADPGAAEPRGGVRTPVAKDPTPRPPMALPPLQSGTEPVIAFLLPGAGPPAPPGPRSPPAQLARVAATSAPPATAAPVPMDAAPARAAPAGPPPSPRALPNVVTPLTPSAKRVAQGSPPVRSATNPVDPAWATQGTARPGPSSSAPLPPSMVQAGPIAQPVPAPLPPPSPLPPTAVLSPPVAAEAPPPSAPAVDPAVASVAAGPSAPPRALRAELVDQPKGATRALALPVQASTGAAAFRRGSDGIVVLDERTPLDLSVARADPSFGAATVQLLPEATLVRLPLAADQSLALSRDRGHWVVAIVPTADAAAGQDNAPAAPGAADGRIALPMPGASQVVATPDASTGADLLVGTVRLVAGAGSGPAISAPRRMPGLSAPATWLGVVIEPLSDQIALRAATDSFVVASDPDGLALSSPPADSALLAGAAGLTRSFDLPLDTVPALSRLVQARVENAAAAAPLSRGKLRRRAAEAMLALGLGAEAQALLRVAAVDSPSAAADPLMADLSAVAALLAGRLDETDALKDPRSGAMPGDTDERAFWRAVRDATLREGSPDAAQVFAATAALLRAYPPPLRDRLLPLVAETMALGGQARAAAALLASFPDDPSLAMARALLAMSEGRTDAALALFDRIAETPDRLARTRAIRRATELRLATGAIDAAEAARRLDPQIAGWQGDSRELDTRLRVAELRAQSGEPRQALDLLRATEAVFPEEPRVRRSMHAVLDGVLGDAPGGKGLTAIDFAALMADFADLLPSDDDGALAMRFADRLAALDLTRRAGPLVERVMRAAAPGSARAALGARLAAWRLADDDCAGAQAALAESDPSSTPPGASVPTAVAQPVTLPDDLRSRRLVLRARALAGAGDPTAGASLLAGIGGEEALSARADILERARDWPAATEALGAWAARAVPAAGALTEPQARVLLRLAAAAAQSSDAAALTQARASGRGRMGAFENMLSLIAADPVRAPGDLARSARETRLARAVASALPPAPVAR